MAEAAEFAPSTLRTSVQDMALGIRPWDFSVEDIAVPVHMWHGDLDRNVPLAHDRALATLIPHATLHECSGEGHWLVVGRTPEILELLAIGQ